MSSSLAKQLEQLRIKEDQSRKLESNKIASLVFETSHAASLDWQTIQQLANQSFQRMSIIESRLTQYQAFLFKGSKTQRSKLTESENQKISCQIEEVLLILQPYFLQKDGQMVIEYLLRNFEVHVYDAFIMISIMLPYHKTILFVKLLQNIDLNTVKVFSFMETNIRNGLNIQRQSIIKQVLTTNQILERLIQMLKKQYELKYKESQDVLFDYSSDKVHQKQLDSVLINFITTVIIEVINHQKSQKINDNLLSIIFSYISFAISNPKSQNNLVLSSMMIMQILFTQNSKIKSNIPQDIAFLLLKKLNSHNHNSIQKQIVEFFIILYQNSILKSIDKRSLDQVVLFKDIFIKHSKSINILQFVYRIIEFQIQNKVDDQNSLNEFNDQLVEQIKEQNNFQNNHQLQNLFLSEIVQKCVQYHDNPQTIKLIAIIKKYFQNEIQNIAQQMLIQSQNDSEQQERVISLLVSKQVHDFNNILSQISQRNSEKKKNSLQYLQKNLSQMQISSVFYQIMHAFKQEQSVELLKIYFQIFAEIQIQDPLKFVNRIQKKIEKIGDLIQQIDLQALKKVLVNLKKQFNFPQMYYSLVFSILQTKNQELTKNKDLYLEKDQKLFQNHKQMFSLFIELINRNQNKFLNSNKFIIRQVLSSKMDLSCQMKIAKELEKYGIQVDIDFYHNIFRMITVENKQSDYLEMLEIANQQTILSFYNICIDQKSFNEQLDFLMQIYFQSNQGSIQYILLKFLQKTILSLQKIDDKEQIILFLELFIIEFCDQSHNSRLIIKQIFEYIYKLYKQNKSDLKQDSIFKVLKIVNKNILQINGFQQLQNILSSNQNSKLNEQIFDKLDRMSCSKYEQNLIRMIQVNQLQGIDQKQKLRILEVIEHNLVDSKMIDLYVDVFYTKIERQFFNDNYKKVIKEIKNDELTIQILEKQKKKIKLNMNQNSQILICLIDIIFETKNINLSNYLTENITKYDIDKQFLLNYYIQIYEQTNSDDIQQFQFIYLLLELNHSYSSRYNQNMIQFLELFVTHQQKQFRSDVQILVNQIIQNITKVSKDDDKQSVIEISKKYIQIIELIDPKQNQEMEVEDEGEQDQSLYSQLHLQYLYSLYESMIRIIDFDFKTIYKYLNERVQKYQNQEIMNSQQLFSFLMFLFKKMNENHIKFEKKTHDLYNKATQTFSILMISNINDQNYVLGLFDQLMKTFNNIKSWIIQQIVHNYLQQVENKKQIKDLNDFIIEQIAKMPIKQSLSIIQDILKTQKRMFMNGRTSKMKQIKKGFEMTNKQQKINLKQILIMINNVLNKRVIQNKIEKQLIIDSNELVSTMSQIYIQILKLELYGQLQEKWSKQLILIRQIEQFISNILPFEFYVKLVINVQQQINKFTIKQILYQKVQQKLLKKSKKMNKQTEIVVLELVESIFQDLQNNYQETNDSKDYLMYLQGSFMLISLILKLKPNLSQKLKIDKDILTKYIENKNILIQSCGIYSLILFSDSQYLLMNQKQITSKVFNILVQNDGVNIIKNNIIDKLKKIKIQKIEDSNYNVLQVELVLKSIDILVDKMQNMLSPYLNDFVIILSNLKNNKLQLEIKELVLKIGQSYQLRLFEIHELINVCYDNDHSLIMISQFILSLLKSITSEVFMIKDQLLFKSIISLLEYSRKTHIIPIISNNLDVVYTNINRLEEYVIDCFVQFCLKSNEVQLRKYYSNLKNWADKQLHSKYLFFRINQKLADKFQSFFVQFYQFIYEDLLNVIESESKHSNKYEEFINREIQLLAISNFESLFRNDKEDFIDNSKLECIQKPLCQLFLEKDEELIKRTSSCLLALFNLVSDDYKRKDIHHNVIVHLQEEDQQIQLNVLAFLTELIQNLQDSYIPLINDLMPYLSELLDDQSVEIESASKALVIKLEQVSGENIRDYIRK